MSDGGATRATMGTLFGQLYNGKIPVEFHDLLRQLESIGQDGDMSPTSRAGVERELAGMFAQWLDQHPHAVWNLSA